MTKVKSTGCGRRLRGVLFVLGFLFSLAVSQVKAAVLENGIDPANLGKGDWIFILSTATSQHGGLDGLMAYEKSQGINYLIVKAGDGSDVFPSAGSPQFTSNVVDSAHAAGLKIFGYTRSYGTNIPGELAIITNSISLGADGYIIDAEQEWESVPNNSTVAQQLLQPIKAAFPNRFLGHSPQMYIHFHTAFPYTKFGIYCDAAMPQAYWKSFGITPTQCLSDLATDWQNWQNSLTGTNRSAIKPIAPVAQGYTPASDPVTAAEITEFCNVTKTSANSLIAGIKSVNYFRSELHSTEMWDAIRTNSVGDAQPVAPFVYRVQATNITDTSATITWTTDAKADSVLDIGKGPGYSNSITNTSLATSHSVIISGLTQTNTYHFRVRSKVGGSTNVTYSGDFAFTTRIAGFVPDIIIDNTNATVVGSWSSSTSATDKYGADYRFRTVGTGANSLLYSPTITQSGLYQIFETHPQGSNRSTNTPHIVTFFGGVVTNLVNQAINGGVAGGKFNPLTTVYFKAGTAGSLRISDASPIANGLQVMADAIKFVYVGQPAPPSITAQPQGTTVSPGSSVTFAAAASGLAPLTYQWQFNGDDIPGATSSTHVRANVQSSDAGTYTVVVSNPGGSIESIDAVLNITAAPSITAQPVSLTVNPGDSASFTVAASGTPAPTFQWWFEGTPIADATDSTLALASVQFSQSGNYWVVASNSSGSVTSSIVSLTVITPPAITAQPISQVVTNGGDVIFSVTAFGTTPLSYQWFFNGAPIPGATNSSLPIVNAQAINAGNYAVVISNSVGSVTSSTASLTVNPPPVSDIILDNTNAIVVGAWSSSSSSTDKYGADYRFRTVGTGANALIYIPTITQAGLYQIFETHPQGSNRSTNAAHIITSATGVFTNLVNQSVGGGVAGGKFNPLTTVYFKVGTNGSVKISDVSPVASTLQVMADAIKFVYVGQPDAPSITVQPFGRTVGPGSSVTFAVTASSLAPLTYQWQFNGDNIPGATNATYVRANVQLADAGAYTVVVSNPGGSTESNEAILNVVPAPSITAQPVSVVVNPGAPVSFTVAASGSPTFQWWFEGAPIADATDSTFALASVQPSQAGNYWVVASNAGGSVTSSIVSLTLNIPAGIAQQPVSQSVTIGGNATFSVTATGTAPLSYQWTFNGAPIAGASASSYTVVNAQTNNAGNYAVVVSNVAGSVTSSSASLTVNIPAGIAQQPVSQSVTLGGNATFSVAATGTAPLNYQWTFNGAPIAGASASSYTVVNAQTNNAGNYAVVVSNVAGSVTSSTASLTVNIPAGIAQQPVSQSVTLGDNATFSVAATGTAPLNYQWTFNGAPIAGASASSYTVVNAQTNNAGNYAVVVSNVAGSVTSSTASLTVNIPAGIAQQPVSQSVTVGGNATFSVTATGTAPLSYQWTFNGAPIFGASSSSYTVLNAQTNNAGSYAVVVSNVAGSVTSSTASLVVNVPPGIELQPVSQSVTIGSNATFNVTATGTAPLNYQWMFEGAPISSATDSSYTVENAQTNNAGNYAVLISNVAGSITSSIVSLTVNIPPSITQDPVSQIVTMGSNASFTVDVSGSPAPTFQWWFAGAPIADATESTLALANAQPEQAGEYWVVASNAAGSVTSSIVSLTVNIPAGIAQQPVSQSVTIGSNATFSVTAIGTAPLSYQWTFNGAPIVGANASSYTVLNAQPGNAGSYAVQVSNVAGSVTSSTVSLAVNIPPSITQQPVSQTVIAGSNATFSVTASGTGPLHYQWLFAGAPIAGASQSTYVLTGVQANQAGNYQVVVSNVAGSVTSSAVSLTVNVPPRITQQPASQTVIMNSDATLSVTATGTGPLHYQWSFEGSPIPGATGSSYTISKAKKKDGGSYAVVISNVAGSITSANAVITIGKKNEKDVERIQLMSASPNVPAHLSIAGTPGVTYMIEGSSNLVNWTELGSVVSTNGTIDLSDTAASNPSVNFFRTRQMAEPASTTK